MSWRKLEKQGVQIRKFNNRSDKGQSRQNKIIRDALLTGMNDKCYYCKCDVFPAVSGQPVQLHNTATIDHRYSRNDLRRNMVKEKKNIVIACHECNDRRAAEENAIMKSYEPKEHPYLIGILAATLNIRLSA